MVWQGIVLIKKIVYYNTNILNINRVGPDTSNKYKIYIGYEHCGGYYYPDTFINVFSHTHLVGAGVVDYGYLGVIKIIKKILIT